MSKIPEVIQATMSKIREMVDVPVALEKDGNCAALGELWCGSATDLRDKNFVTLVLGTGTVSPSG